MRNCRYGPKENEGNYGLDDGVFNQGYDLDAEVFNRGYELNAEVFNSRHDLDVPGEGQEVDGTGYEGDDEGIDGSFKSYGREYWKELVDGLEASDTDSTDGGNEDAKEGQGEKKEAQKYWIHPEDGQRV